MKHISSHVHLKQIRVWRVALYTALTFGLYTVVWFVKRRRELGDSQPRTPHWIWLLSIASLITVGFISLLVAVYMQADTRQGAELFVYGMYGLTIVSMVGYVWWFSRYALVISRAVQAPLSRPLTIALAVFFVPALMLMLQYTINRPLSSRPNLERPLLYMSAVVIAVSLGLTISQYMRQPISAEIVLFAQELEATKRMMSEQQACLEKITDKSDVDATKACFDVR